jgi:hypothetical protein
MGDENATNPQSDSNNPVIPPVSITEYTDEAEGRLPNPNSENDNTSNKDKEPINLIVNLPIEDKRPQKQANLIGWIGIGINLILAFVTYLLFLKTTEANQTSQDAVKEAKRANDISEQSRITQNTKDSNDAVRDIISDSLSKIKDSMSQDLSRRSLQAQISSIKETAKQFEITNRPYLQVVNPEFRSLVIGKPLEMTYRVKNLGKYPVKIIQGKVTVISSSEIPAFSVLFDNQGKSGQVLNSYLITDESSVFDAYGANNVSQAEFDNIVSDKANVYLLGMMVYENLVTGDMVAYKFILKKNMNDDFPLYIYTEHEVIKGGK